MSAVEAILDGFAADLGDVRDDNFAAVTLTYWASLHMSAASALHALGADAQLVTLDRLLRVALKHRFGGGRA